MEIILVAQAGACVNPCNVSIRLRKQEQLILVAFLSLLLFPLLFIFRAMDDNVLARWQWAFRSADIPFIFSLVFASIAVSLIISHIRLPERYFLPLLGILSFSICVPLWSLPELILDASRYFTQAKHLEIFGLQHFLSEWGRGVPAWTDMPVVPLIYGVTFRLLGEHRLSIQVVTTTLFSLSVVHTYFLGKQLWDAHTGFNAGLLLMAVPYLLLQVPMTLVDVAVMFFLSGAIYHFMLALYYGGLRRTLVASLFIVLAAFSKYSVAPMLCIIALFPLAGLGVPRKALLLRTLAVLGPAASVGTIIIVAYKDVVIRQLTLLRTYQIPALSKWGESFVSSFLFQSHPYLVLLATIAVFLAIRSKERKLLIPAWFLILVLLFQVHRLRYILPLFPLFAIMAAYGLHIFRDEEVKRFISLCALSTTLVIVFTGFAPFLRSSGMSNLQQAGKFIDSLPYAAYMVMTIDQEKSLGNTSITVPILDLYTQKTLVLQRNSTVAVPENAPNDWPLRFTWDFDIADIYAHSTSSNEVPVIIISGKRMDLSESLLPQGLLSQAHFEVRRFESVSPVFRFQTFVYVFTIRNLSISAQ